MFKVKIKRRALRKLQELNQKRRKKAKEIVLILKTDLLAKVLPWSLLFSITGTGIGILALLTIERNGYLQVLSHGITFQFDPLILALQLIFTSLIVAISILHSFKSQI